jgi:integrase
VRRFLGWCASEGRAASLDRLTVTAFTAGLLEDGAEATTARARQLAVRRFSAWLASEGEIPRDDLAGVKGPQLDQKVVHPLSDDEIRRMIRACDGTTGDLLRDRRDEALIRFMVETGTRAGEVAAMHLSDVDLRAGTAVIRRGKGGKGRMVPFGAQTVRALDRYIRARRTHKLAATDALWLGNRGHGFTYDALHKSLAMRARLADVHGFHPHRLRHTAAHRWLAAGGSEGGLMAVAGWQRPEMLMRYTKAQAEARAAEEARRLNLGEL